MGVVDGDVCVVLNFLEIVGLVVYWVWESIFWKFSVDDKVVISVCVDINLKIDVEKDGYVEFLK